MKPLKIGITFDINGYIPQLIWGSGLNQNILFYYDMFQAMGHDVYIMGSKSTNKHMTIGNKKYNTTTASEVITQSIPFNLIMEAGLSIPAAEREQMRKRCGARIIATRFGNAAMIDSEELSIHDGNDGKKCHLGGVEMLWACPHHYRQAGYWEVLYGAPVRPAPFVWEPRFVQKNYHWDSALLKKPDVVLPDPNFSVVKNSLVPLLIINQFLSASANRFSVEKIRIMNSDKIEGKNYFKTNFLNNLAYLDNCEISYEGRIRFCEIFTRPDIMLVWQHINDLNYMYYEALYTGVPLVHNSDLHKEVGFYYKDTDIKAAVKHLETICNGYDRKVEREHNQAFLNTASIYNPIIQQRYAMLLEESMSLPIRT